MILFAAFFGVCICLLSGYIGGYTLDKQMRAAELPFKRVTIPRKIKRIFVFSRSSPCHVLLTGVIMEFSGLAISSAIIVSALLWLFFRADFLAVLIMLFPLLHGFVLIAVSLVFCARYAVLRKNASGSFRRSWKCEMMKAISTAPVVCPVKVVCTPKEGSGGLYQIEYGAIVPRKFYAKAADGYFPPAGERTNAIYCNGNPPFCLVPGPAQREQTGEKGRACGR